MVVTRGGKRCGRAKWVMKVKYMVMERNQISDGEYSAEYKDTKVYSCATEHYIILVINITPINLTKKINKTLVIVQKTNQRYKNWMQIGCMLIIMDKMIQNYADFISNS